MKRHYGGAKLIEGTLFEDPTLDVPPATGQDGTTDYRRVVAKKAAELIEEGDIIFVNSSKTALLMLDYISGKRVSVITNNGNAITSSHDPLVSIILTGGELPAMVMIDCISRLVPGVLNNDVSAEFESFHDNLLEYPQYTRPEEYKGLRVPEVLLSGHHKNIDTWRREQSIKRTYERRPDLLKDAVLSKKEQEYLESLAKKPENQDIQEENCKKGLAIDNPL